MAVDVITPDIAPLFTDRLFAAVLRGDSEEIRALAQAGMDITTHHPIHTRTMLMEATRTNQPKLVSFLIELSAEVNLPELQPNKRRRRYTPPKCNSAEELQQLLERILAKGSQPA